MRRTISSVLALLLGVGAALLAACGSNTTAGIPAASADDLKSQIEDVQQAVDDGRCSDVPGQLRQVDERIDRLPPSTDDQLERSLRDGAETLRGVAVEECDETPTETTTTEELPAETTTAPAETTTQPAETTTTETSTQPRTQTSPPPPPPPEAPPAPEPEPEPPTGTPGGGVEPEVP
ncbi:MAG TPA: hypothetical protein VG474_08865 [Solirubrobacteraceae bacterium]|nr:hypothetical protein [Solirubrobacteraceae bacterium]